MRALRNIAWALLPIMAWACAPAQEERSLPPLNDIQGSPLFHVLAQDAIRAVFDPEFVFGEEADAQMRPDEPVLGVFDGTAAHAYSVWQLEDHEVVDDVLGDTPLAATW